MALDVMVGARQETAVDNSPIGTYRFSYNSGGHYKPIRNRRAQLCHVPGHTRYSKSEPHLTDSSNETTSSTKRGCDETSSN